MTENVTSINQNGNGGATSGDATADALTKLFNQKEAQVEHLRRQSERLQEENQKEPVKLEDVLNRLQPPENYEPTYELRPLKTPDSRFVRQMVRKFVKNENLQELVGGNPNPEDMLKLVDFFFDELEDEILPWAVSLTGKTEEEWEQQPASADTDVLNDLKANEDFLGAVKSAAFLGITGKALFGR